MGVLLQVGIVSFSRILHTRIRTQLPEFARIATVFENEDVSARCEELGIHLLFYEVHEAEVTTRMQVKWRQLAQVEGLAVILIMHDPSPAMQLKAMHCGITDVIVDTPLLEQEIVRFSRLRQGELQPEPGNLDVAIRSFGEAVVTIHGKRVMLTKTEYHILRVLIDRKGGFVTTQTLTERVWGADFFERKDDLYVYIARLREKLEEIPSKPKLIISSRGFGYAFHGDVVIDRQFG